MVPPRAERVWGVYRQQDPVREKYWKSFSVWEDESLNTPVRPHRLKEKNGFFGRRTTASSGTMVLVIDCEIVHVRLDRVSNDGYKSCRGLRIYSQALLWDSASCRRRVRALRSLSDLSLALSSNATTLNHLIRLRGSQGIQIWKQRTH